MFKGDEEAREMTKLLVMVFVAVVGVGLVCEVFGWNFNEALRWVFAFLFFWAYSKYWNEKRKNKFPFPYNWKCPKCDFSISSDNEKTVDIVSINHNYGHR